MRIEGRDGFVEFTFTREEKHHWWAPALVYFVHIESGGFVGKQGEILFPKIDLKDFLAQLRSLERQRQGEAILYPFSDSAYTFGFKVFSIDKLGHIAVFAEISRFISFHRVESKVTVSFEIDPSTMPVILADFEELFSQPQA